MERRERRLRAPSMGGSTPGAGRVGKEVFKIKKNREGKKKKRKEWDIYSHPRTVLGSGWLSLPGYGQEGLVELSREDWERRRASGPMLESAREEVGKSLYQPATALERSSSSRTI